jgi:hypothetical protein
MYQLQLEQYTAHPDAFGRAPEFVLAPLTTVLLRIGGRLVNLAGQWIAWTGGLWLAALLMGERDLHPGTTARIVAWSWLPLVLRGLVQSIYMGLSGDPIHNPGLSGFVLDNTPPPPGGGYRYVMPAQGEQILAALLSRLDIYGFWHLGLIVAGLRREGRLPYIKSIVLVAVVGTVLLLLGLLPVLFPNTLMRFRFF